MNANDFWEKSYEHVSNFTPQQIWTVFADSSNWKVWNSGVKSIQIEGEFVTGSWFSMELPDGNIIRSQLIDVSERKHFIDESWIGETMVKVAHRIESLQSGLSQITYIISTHGPDAQAFGEGISADFPNVLAGLEKYLSEQKA